MLQVNGILQQDFIFFSNSIAMKTKMRTIAFCLKWQNLLNKRYLALISPQKNISYNLAHNLYCLYENCQYICINNWLLSFQQKAIVLISVAMATNFEHKLNCAEEFYKLAKFQANIL